MEELLKSLIAIQQELKAPKDKENRFGGYKYRSLEGIEESIKPLLAKYNCGIRFNDEVVEHCGRTFLHTTLHFFNDKGQEITTTAEAGHENEKKGMDFSQITGAASSYARKYAMNAMFAIDDSKDADTEEFHNMTNQQAPAPKQTNRKPAAQPNGKYAQIQSALNAVTDIAGLTALYKSHEAEVNGNPEVKNLFSQRKQQLNIV